MPKPDVNPGQGSFIEPPEAASAFNLYQEVEGHFYKHPSEIVNLAERIEQPELARRVLDVFAVQNRQLGLVKKQQAELDRAKALVDRIDIGERIEDAQRRAANYDIEAKHLFAQAIGIETIQFAKETEDGRAIEVVEAKDEGLKRELEFRYDGFYKLYGGLGNVKRRDLVRDGKAELIIPTYSEADRQADVTLSLQEQSQDRRVDEPAKPLMAPGNLPRPVALNEPGQPVPAVDILKSYDFMTKALSALGVRATRMRHGSFEGSHRIGLDSSSRQTTLPEINWDDKALNVINQNHLNYDQIIKLAKVYFAKAIGLSAMRSSGVNPLAEADQTASSMWQEFWTANNGSDELSENSRKLNKAEFEDAIKSFRRLQKEYNRGQLFK